MKTPREVDLSLDSEVFASLKKDFEDVLTRTLTGMQESGSDAARINIAMDICFKCSDVNDPKPDNIDALRRQIVPDFEHKVSSVIAGPKETVKGRLAGNFELVFDAARQAYVVREIISPQQTIFDDWQAKQ